MEYSLVLFTTLAQLATALALMTTIVAAWQSKGHIVFQRYFLRITGMACFPITALAGLAAFLHLGDPWGAFRAFSHTETSWLSREVWAAAIFGGISLICSYTWWSDRSRLQTIWWSGAAAVAGLGTVFTSSQVYQLQAHAVWNTIFTPLSFFASTLLFIPASALALLVWNRKNADGVKDWEQLIGLAAYGIIGAAMVEFILIGAQIYAAVGMGDPGLTQYLFVRMGTVYWARILFSVVIPVLIGSWVLQRSLYSPGLKSAVVSMLVLVILGELGGRMLFFSSVMNMPRF